MLKLVRAIALLAVLGLIPSIPPVAQAQDVSSQTTVGICGLYYLSGRLVIDGSGQVVPLGEYCRQPVIEAGKTPEGLDESGHAFWQAFLVAASPTAVTFAESVGRDAVMDYGSTVCPFLREGGTLSQLRQVQMDGQIPQSFEAAVSVAAINTYCPEYRSQIGR